jgi:DNA-binding SARP family transcriptional activator
MVRGSAALVAEVDTPAPRLNLLGDFELTLRESAIPMALGAQRLLAFLALERAPVRRGYVAGALWPDSEERRAAGNLRSALWRIRATGIDIVRATPTDLRLSPGVRVDLDEAMVHATRIAAAHGAWVDVAGVDVAALTRDLLVGWYDDWIVFERERFRQMRLHVLESLGERQLALGQPAEAIQCAIAAIDGDPLRESAHRLLLKAYLAEGNAAGALRHFHSLCDLLTAELGVAPSEDLASLVQPSAALPASHLP